MGKKLAIRGHSTRGKEVIELLEMMGGKNVRKLEGGANMYSYYLSDNIITSDRLSIAEDDDFEIFNLEDFLEKFPYKVGDKVHIYVQNDDIDGRLDTDAAEITSMRWNPDIRKIAYKMKDINREFYKEEISKDKIRKDFCERCGSQRCSGKDDELEYCERFKMWEEEPKAVISGICLNSCDYADEVELNLGDYEIKVRDGKTYAVKKKKYPTTYTECCEVIAKSKPYAMNEYYADVNKLLQTFQSLLICHNAYMKIFGEQMGLDGPWKPDWNDQRPKYTITVIGNQLIKHYSLSQNYIFAFPTEEMRDAFYENFKNEIEQCKELL